MEDNLDYVEAAINATLRSNVYTMLPGVVTKVEKFEDKQTVNVKPTVGRKFLDGQYKEPPEILSCPVMFPSAGGGILSFPIQVGDTVAIFFGMRDMDNWSLGDGSTDQEPNSTRHYSVNDAVVLPGLFPKSQSMQPDPDHVQLKFADSSVTLKNDGDVEVDVASNLKATVAEQVELTAGGKVVMTAPTVEMNGNTGGVVTTQSINPLTGTPYPHGSATVLAGL